TRTKARCEDRAERWRFPQDRVEALVYCRPSYNRVTKQTEIFTEGNKGNEGTEGSSNIQHPTSNIQHPTSNIQHPTSNIQHPTSNIQHPTSNIQKSSKLQEPSTRETSNLKLQSARCDRGVFWIWTGRSFSGCWMLVLGASVGWMTTVRIVDAVL